MPFDSNPEEEARVAKKQVGVKLQNKPSTQPNPANSRKEFEKQADEKFSQIEDHKQQIWDLSLKYKSFIESKTLLANKGPLVLDLEKETLDKLVQLSIDMNEDEAYQQGMGSSALCMLLMKCMLIQRDIINELAYKLEQMQKQLVILDKNKQDK